MQDLSHFVSDRTAVNSELGPLVDRAMAHALSLQSRAEQLDNLLKDTRESSEAALNASSAYNGIVDAINDALNASREAVKAANQALDQVIILEILRNVTMVPRLSD